MKFRLRPVLAGLFVFCIFAAGGAPIDRLALVTRHDVVLTHFDPLNPLSVGNGGFCFTVDATGLQTFPEAFEKTTPLGTLSDWGWHTAPNPNHWSMDTFHFTDFPDLNGRPVPYADVPHDGMTPEIKWLRDNPHRLDLGQIGFVLRHMDGSPATPGDILDVIQTLDLWNGKIVSQFEFDGEPVTVETICHPALDAIAVRVSSTLIGQGRLAIQIHFPYGTGDETTMDWNHPDAHTTILTQPDSRHAQFYRKLDNDRYYAAAGWSESATLTRLSKHQFEIVPSRLAHELEFVCAFSPTRMNAKKLPAFAQAASAAREHWNKFWQTGGAIDLSGSADNRWFELERRIVLSEYLTAIQGVG
jgi:hypothetical protein